MKNLLALSILFSITFISCNKGKNPGENTKETDEQIINKTAHFPLDSIKVNDSLQIVKNLSVGFQSTMLIFPTIKNKTLLDSIYAPQDICLETYSKASLTQALNEKKQEFFKEQKESLVNFKPEFAQNWNNNSDMKLFLRDNGFLTIQYSVDGYTGGAHGFYNETYKVFDLKNNRTVQLTDIVSNEDSKIWNPVLMDNFTHNDGDKGQVEMLLVKQIPLNNNFYFDKENLYFLYNQYEITAYAAGTVLIKIPLSDIKPLLTDEFKSRQNL